MEATKKLAAAITVLASYLSHANELQGVYE
jgi:hypothetical protein